MKSRTHKKETSHTIRTVFRLTLQQNRPLIWGLMLLFFFALPVAGALSPSVQSIVGSLYRPVASRVGFDSVLLLIGIVCVLLSLRLFSWQYRKRSADFYDALPVDRAQAVLGRYAAFIFLVAGTVTVNTLFWIMLNLPDLFACMERQEAIFYGVLVPLTLPVFTFAACTFCALCTQLSGTVRGAAGFMLLYTAAWPALVLCLETLQQIMLPFLELPFSGDTLLYFGVSPLSGGVFLHAWFFNCHDDLTMLLICTAYWAALSLVFLLLLKRLAGKRLSEGAQITARYPRFTLFSSVLFALCTGLSGACMACKTTPLFWPLLLLLSCAAAYGARYLTHGGKRLLRSGSLIFAGSMLLFCGVYAVFATGLCGYAQRAPARSDIAEAFYDAEYEDGVGNRVYPYADEPYSSLKNGTAVYLKDEKAIGLIYQAHQNELTRLKKDFPYFIPRNYQQDVYARYYERASDGPRFLTISYRLKNGTVFTRRFTLEADQMPGEAELALFSLDSYYENCNALPRLSAYYAARPGELQAGVTIGKLGSMDFPESIWGEKDTQHLLSLLDADLRAETAEQLAECFAFGSSDTKARFPQDIRISLSGRNSEEDAPPAVLLPLLPSYEHTRSFLQAKGILAWIQQQRDTLGGQMISDGGPA